MKPCLTKVSLYALAVSWMGACGSGRAGLTSDGPGSADNPNVAAQGTGGSPAGGATGGSAGTSSPDAGGSCCSTVDAGSAGATGAAGATDAGATDAGATDAGATDAGEADGGFADATPLVDAAIAGCSSGGWCWSTPAPQGNPLYSIWGSSSSDVWAVGESGAIVHWNGKVWSQVPSGVAGALRSVWAASPSDAWTVGDDAAVLHWNGSAWSPRSDVPATGYYWRAVWGTSASDVWIVGGNEAIGGGAMMHWDGADWTTYAAPEAFDAIWGPRSNDIWGLDDSHGFHHWDGTSWTTVSTGDLPQIGTALWGTGSGDLWLSARSAAQPSHWNGQAVAVGDDTNADINGLWGSGADDVWAVGDSSPDWFGDGGLILHWNGVRWQQMPNAGASHLYGVWGSSADDVWAVGESGDLVHWDGRAWSPLAGPGHVNLFSLWANDPDDVWAFGYDRNGLGALHWDGQSWVRTDLLDHAALGSSEDGFDVPYVAWGSGRDDIWLGVDAFEPIANQPGTSTSRSLFVHWDGQRWSAISLPDANLAASFSINSLWGNGRDDVWAVGSIDDGNSNFTGHALHWDGKRWTEVSSLSAADRAHAFVSVWTSGANDVWIGGGGGVHHWDGTAWSQPVSATDQGSFLVAGSASTDVWAVKVSGDDNSVVTSRWDGHAWRDMVVPGFEGPNAIIAISPTNAWLHGDEGAMHWNGEEWTPSDAGTIFFGSNFSWDGTQLWVVAMRGLLRHP
jgi:hypothetical protein